MPSNLPQSANGFPPTIDEGRLASAPARWNEVRSQEHLVSGTVSFLLHLLAVLLLGFVFSISLEDEDAPRDLVMVIEEVETELTESGDSLLPTIQGGSSVEEEPQGVPVTIAMPTATPVAWQDAENRTAIDQATTRTAILSDQITLPTGAATGGGVEGRSGGLKGQLLANRGGTPESEEAVARGLRWLAAHQEQNGRLRFDHTQGPCRGHCRHPGSEACSTASTALAILPFLGAGQTHRVGEHREVVERGLLFLAKQMHLESRGGDFRTPAGNLYGQGIATLAFCEAYAMSGDEELRKFAQAGIDFIVAAQHEAGGWRYEPGEPGDTTVTGWQLMALKSARLAGLQVPQSAIYRAAHFLDSVAVKEGNWKGILYGYQTRNPRQATTAIALYSRMLTGWHRSRSKLAQGVGYLADLEPSPDDMYFNYYATMVLHHFDGPQWPAWNERMRERLIAEQATEGHEAGSWYYPHEHSEVGGRLYNTCMALMTLEVYYRYMPLYGGAPTMALGGPPSAP
ncbi:MAG: hypothetical protein VX431_05465 [Planctomycetota bacterium]|nr:hypothetical protein [Planctomycetota bacterium]